MVVYFVLLFEKKNQPILSSSTIMDIIPQLSILKLKLIYLLIREIICIYIYVGFSLVNM